MVRLLVSFTLAAGLSLLGQAGRAPWWTGPNIRDLNLSAAQMRQMRVTIREYRPHLEELRAAVRKAEQDLEDAFNGDPVDTPKANAAIDRLAAARAELTRTLSQMGLKLRTVLTLQQWQQVEKKFPPKVNAKPPDSD